MIKRNPTKPVRVVPPMMEEQEVSTITLQEWLDREETVSHLLFCKGKRRRHRQILQKFQKLHLSASDIQRM